MGPGANEGLGDGSVSTTCNCLQFINMSISTDYRQDQHLGFGSNHRLVCAQGSVRRQWGQEGKGFGELARMMQHALAGAWLRRLMDSHLRSKFQSHSCLDSKLRV